MNGLNLYQITQEINDLLDMVIQDGGEITDASSDLERQVQVLLENKIEGCVHYLERLEDSVKLADEKAKALIEYKKKQQNKIERFKEYIGFCLEKSGKESFESDMYKVKFRKPVKTLNITDENSIPVEFTTVKTTVSIDKRAVLKALKDGVTVDGAEMVEGKKSLIMGLK